MSCFVMNERNLAGVARFIYRLMNVNDNIWHGFSSDFKQTFSVIVFNDMCRDEKHSEEYLRNNFEEHIYTMLYLYNLKSYSTRYKEVYEEDFVPTFNPKDMSPFQFLKSLDCWLYQSMDDDGVYESEFYKILEKISNIYTKWTFNHLPEYQNAEWG